ncbi:MAG: tRNA lysidine(34) synthetase TilS [Pseudomonadota bacterium]
MAYPDEMGPLAARVKHFCQQQGFEPTYWVAYSGGLDSHVLLHVLAQLRDFLPLKLRAIHVNHNLSPNAAAWATHCARICTQLNIELVQATVDASASGGESPENKARQARYVAIMREISTGDMLVTAHHQDDQAETLLLQLCRGAGPKGLAAMPALKVFGAGWLGRPLLDCTRAILRDYAVTNQLQWIEDESNANQNFARNFIRHEVLPVLQQRWPAVTKTLGRSASNCAEAQHLLDEIAAQDIATVSGTKPGTLSVSKLLTLSPRRQRLVLRFWLRQAGFTVPSTVKLRQVQHDMLLARADKQPVMHWPQVELRRYQDELYASSPLAVHDTQQIYSWHYPQPLVLTGLGELRAQAVTGSGLAAELQDVSVRFRRGGEVCRLPARTGHHDLKKLFQSWRIPAWQRDRIPLVYVGEQLAAVVGWCVSEDFAAKAGDPGYVLALHGVIPAQAGIHPEPRR